MTGAVWIYREILTGCTVRHVYNTVPCMHVKTSSAEHYYIVRLILNFFRRHLCDFGYIEWQRREEKTQYKNKHVHPIGMESTTLVPSISGIHVNGKKHGNGMEWKHYISHFSQQQANIATVWPTTGIKTGIGEERRNLDICILKSDFQLLFIPKDLYYWLFGFTLSMKNSSKCDEILVLDWQRGKDNNRWDWKSNGNKTWLSMGVRMAMGMNHWEQKAVGRNNIPAHL